MLQGMLLAEKLTHSSESSCPTEPAAVFVGLCLIPVWL